MSNNSNTFRISNEQLLLINILNTMYNDNLRQINNITDTLNNLNNTNNQIRNLLVQLLNSPQMHNNNSRRNGFSERRYRENNDRNTNMNPNRVYLNNRPYIIDSITEYTIPRSFISTSRNMSTNPTETSARNLFNELFSSFMEPVEVYPTQSQIEAATRRVRYCDISRPAYTQCPISLEDFNDNEMVTVIRPCGHIFQSEHLMNWFRTNCRCPVCRFDIREYNSNASTEFFNNSNQNNANVNRSSSQSESVFIDSSNNNIERNSINRMDSINSIGSNASNNLYNDIFNDAYFNNITGNTDASGNYVDNMLGGTALAMMLLNAMNRNRNPR